MPLLDFLVIDIFLAYSVLHDVATRVLAEAPLSCLAASVGELPGRFCRRHEPTLIRTKMYQKVERKCLSNMFMKITTESSLFDCCFA